MQKLHIPQPTKLKNELEALPLTRTSHVLDCTLRSTTAIHTNGMPLARTPNDGHLLHVNQSSCPLHLLYWWVPASLQPSRQAAEPGSCNWMAPRITVCHWGLGRADIGLLMNMQPWVDVALIYIRCHLQAIIRKHVSHYGPGSNGTVPWSPALS